MPVIAFYFRFYICVQIFIRIERIIKFFFACSLSILLLLVERLWTEPFVTRNSLKKEYLLYFKHLNKMNDALSL